MYVVVSSNLDIHAIIRPERVLERAEHISILLRSLKTSRGVTSNPR